jgi:opacity protein-like surface antigen
MSKVHQAIVFAAATIGLPTAALSGNSANSGFYVAPAVVAVDHHFVIEETAGATFAERNVTAWGVGASLQAGYDLKFSSKFMLDLQGQVSIGGKTPNTVTVLGPVSLQPRWGYSFTSRAKYALSDSARLYAGGGYGGHNYRISRPEDVGGIPNWNRSFVLVAGGEFNLSRKLSTRIEFQHLDGTRNDILIAFPFHF